MDTNKREPNIRSRINVQECKRGANAAASSKSKRMFSTMPPLEALKLSMLLKASRSVCKAGQVLLIAHFDISHAHLMPRAEKEVSVELPRKERLHESQRIRGALGEVN